jgi:hypothetical protein
MTDSRLRALNMLAARYGYQPAEVTGGGHLRFRHRRTGRLVFTAATPSDRRAMANIRAIFRRPPKVNSNP